ncbi:MAG: pro-sigmaK processing inhibitor BofA family protein [Oscillibacter sp.]|nr:pro-sigmaK processing inhibitor BofA family protein [Oscillibacter sp.]
MDVKHALIALIPALFFLLVLVRLLRTPLRLALGLLFHTLLGLLALWAANLAAAHTGAAPGLNLWNALVVGVLGVPGFLLLLLVQWVF